MSKRKFERFTKRIETRFTINSETYTGIASNISERGIFIRTRRCFAPGTLIHIEFYLPDNTLSIVKGRVKRAVKTQISTMKNGMGVELIEKDLNFINFVNAIIAPENKNMHADFEQKGREEKDPAKQKEPLLIACPNCNIKNKVAIDKIPLNPRCGKCGASLKAEATF
ncbi:MAG: PilZ domain-containing protein [Nitrospirae bacterium]|nr:PilZ domain-containing protein [Nitrospirota bacterium]